MKNFLYLIAFLGLSLVALTCWQNYRFRQGVTSYIDHKQIFLGEFGDDYTISHWPLIFPFSGSKTITASLYVENEIKKGILNLTVNRQGNTLKQASLKLGTDTIHLSTHFVEGLLFFASSELSEPLPNAIFSEGQDVVIQAYTKGFSPRQNTEIEQHLTIIDHGGQIVAHKPRAARYDRPISSTQKDPITFTNRIGNLPAGEYFVKLTFHDKNKETTDEFLYPIEIQSQNQRLVVKEVRYFKNEKELRQAQYKTRERVSLALAITGFQPQSKKIKGIVDLVISDPKGEVISQKPRFAKIENPFEPNHAVVVEGQFQFDEPNVYFLDFYIRDGHSARQVVHREKILVQLGETL